MLSRCKVIKHYELQRREVTAIKLQIRPSLQFGCACLHQFTDDLSICCVLVYWGWRAFRQIEFINSSIQTVERCSDICCTFIASAVIKSCSPAGPVFAQLFVHSAWAWGLKLKWYSMKLVWIPFRHHFGVKPLLLQYISPNQTETIKQARDFKLSNFSLTLEEWFHQLTPIIKLPQSKGGLSDYIIYYCDYQH